jgi:hypothetical protein
MNTIDILYIIIYVGSIKAITEPLIDKMNLLF